MSATRTVHEWSKDAFFPKAQRYAEKMIAQDDSEWEFGFWSAVTLEILIRAAVSNISPVLVAEGKDWNNILYALNKAPNQKKYNPKSASVSELLKKLESLVPEFTNEMSNFSAAHMNRRNTELHSGSLPFDDVRPSSWIPIFYSTCKVLATSMGETLITLFDVETASEADIQIAALLDESAQSVRGTIHACQVSWSAKPVEEKEKLVTQAEILSSKHHGHRAQCPACQSTALLQGSSIRTFKPEISDEMVVEKQLMRPSSFECIACGLKISGFSKLVACGLGDSYTSTNFYSAIEYFEIDFRDMEEYMFEDNNEPF